MYRSHGTPDLKTLDRELREACEKGDHSTVKALCEEGANVHSVNWVRGLNAHTHARKHTRISAGVSQGCSSHIGVLFCVARISTGAQR